MQHGEKQESQIVGDVWTNSSVSVTTADIRPPSPSVHQRRIHYMPLQLSINHSLLLGDLSCI